MRIERPEPVVEVLLEVLGVRDRYLERRNCDWDSSRAQHAGRRIIRRNLNQPRIRCSRTQSVSDDSAAVVQIANREAAADRALPFGPKEPANRPVLEVR